MYIKSKLTVVWWWLCDFVRARVCVCVCVYVKMLAYVNDFRQQSRDGSIKFNFRSTTGAGGRVRVFLSVRLKSGDAALTWSSRHRNCVRTLMRAPSDGGGNTRHTHAFSARMRARECVFGRRIERDCRRRSRRDSYVLEVNRTGPVRLALTWARGAFFS